MRTFNSIQIIVILMAMPTLLNLCKSASFAGAGALFWVGLLGTGALGILATFLVRNGMGK